MSRIFKFFIMLILSATFCLPAFGCSNENNSPSDPGDYDIPISEFTVLLTEDDEKFEITSRNPVSVAQNGDAQFVLKMKGDFCVERILRKSEGIDADIVNQSDRFTTVTVHNIRYSLVVEAECEIAAAYISYYPNGGEYIDGGNSAVPYMVGHALKSRLRPNTEIGTDRIEREGYVLNGWNTKADGSGEHIGLGSRTTVAEHQILSLYAEWEKVTAKSEFQYKKESEGITITQYKGSSERVVVPETIDDLPVVWISRGAFSVDTNVKTVILPPSIVGIADGAFNKSNLKELYFYDNITAISDKCFIECEQFSTIHINAIEAPRFGENLYSEINLADKYDILILNADKKKVVIFGGSGAYFSVNAKQIEEELRGEYVCINMAVNGWFNGAAQFEMIMPYLNQGDVFLHAPESSSMFSFMYSTTMMPQIGEFNYNKLRFYYCLESNYDLFSLIDVRQVEDLFDGFREYNAERQKLPKTSYTDYKTKIQWYGEVYENDLGYIDNRGSCALPRPAGVNNETGEGDAVVEYVTDIKANGRLNGYYSRMWDMGVRVLFATAPVNSDALQRRLDDPGLFDASNTTNSLYYGRPPEIAPPAYESLDEWVDAFDSAVKTYLHCAVFMTLSETLYMTADFFEPDYHLSDVASNDYSGIIADRLKIILFL